MNKHEELDQELKNFNITVLGFPLNASKSFCMHFEKKDYICINNSIEISNFEKYWVLEHELEHIKNNAFYNCNSKKKFIKKQEYKANDALIDKFNLASSTLELLKKGYAKWEICELLEIPDDLYEHTLNYILRKNLK